jgi:hypothetical protein
VVSTYTRDVMHAHKRQYGERPRVRPLCDDVTKMNESIFLFIVRYLVQ